MSKITQFQNFSENIQNEFAISKESKFGFRFKLLLFFNLFLWYSIDNFITSVFFGLRPKSGLWLRRVQRPDARTESRPLVQRTPAPEQDHQGENTE